MGKLDEAIGGQSGFPRVMPGLDQPLTVPQKIACAARILDAEGYALDVAMQVGQTPVPVPPEQRPTLKAAVNSHHMTVRYYWEGAVRRLLREAPEVLN